MLNQRTQTTVVLMAALLSLFCGPRASAQDPADAPPAIPAQITQDSLRDLNSYFPLTVPRSLDAWKVRRQELHKHLLVSLGLWPMPPAPTLDPTIHGLIDKGDYTIEKVYFESLPGFYVTGNLYRPKNVAGKVPGILSPHGHHANGRFLKSSEEIIDQQIAQGAETFRSNAKSVLQARCANLARMGCIVFHYDMIGNADSQQLGIGLIHGFAKQRPLMTDSVAWGLFSPQAESNLQTAMGLQAINSIRALDFLASLPDVDPDRLGVTGCSGGGTQTFILCAIDPRPAAAFPAVMVSTAMQGGCTCENCAYLRVGTGNVELAAMFAPKPIGLTAADDWTKEMETKGFPELQALYSLYQKEDNVQLTSRTEFSHNFNQVSREAMYRWFKQHLRFEGDPIETEIEFVEPSELSVFDQDHPRPAGGDAFEKQLTRYLADFSNQTISESLLGKKATLDDFDNVIGVYVDVVLQSAKASMGRIDSEETEFYQGELADQTVSTLRFPSGWNSTLTHAGLDDYGVMFVGDVDIAVTGESEDARNRLVQECQKLGIGAAVVRHNNLTDADRIMTRRVNNPREAAAYTLGYNAPQIAKRVNAWTNAIRRKPARRYVIASGNACFEVALAAKRLGSNHSILGMAVNTKGMRFQDITDIRDPDLLPGAAKYLDVPGLLSLAAPKPMLLIGEDKQSAEIVVRAYELSGKPENLKLIKSIPDGKSEYDLILDWIRAHSVTAHSD